MKSWVLLVCVAASIGGLAQGAPKQGEEPAPQPAKKPLCQGCTAKATGTRYIRAATSAAADLIGRTADVGTIQPGKYADIIAVSGNPLQDVRALEKVGFVMKGGTIYKNEIAH